MTLTTTLDNRTPDGQSQFIAGPYPGLPLVYGDYSGVVADNLPGAARDVTMTGAGPLSARGRRGADLAGGRASGRSTRGARPRWWSGSACPDGHGVDDRGAVGPYPRRAVDGQAVAHFTDDRPVTISW